MGELDDESSAFRDAFCLAYGVDHPTVPLQRLGHWAALARETLTLDLPIHREIAQVQGGCFYLIEPGPPSRANVERALKMGAAKQENAWLLWPTARRVAEARHDDLAGEDVFQIPAFIESVIEIDTDVETTLSNNLGRHRVREILRLERKAEAAFETRYFRGSDLTRNTPAIVEFERLHEVNRRKYNHVLDPYKKEIIWNLCSSTLKEGLLLKVCRDLGNGQPVQASLALMHHDGSRMTQLVQGQAAVFASTGHNLYIADTLQLVRYGFAKGIMAHSLGRGAETEKARLGANQFFVLNLIAVASGNVDRASMRKFQKACAQVMHGKTSELAKLGIACL